MNAVRLSVCSESQRDDLDAGPARWVEVVDDDRPALERELRGDLLAQLRAVLRTIDLLGRVLALADFLEEPDLEGLARRERSDRQVPVGDREALEDRLDGVGLAGPGVAVERDDPGGLDGSLDSENGIGEWVGVDVLQAVDRVPVLRREAVPVAGGHGLVLRALRADLASARARFVPVGFGAFTSRSSTVLADSRPAGAPALRCIAASFWIRPIVEICLYRRRRRAPPAAGV